MQMAASRKIDARIKSANDFFFNAFSVKRKKKLHKVNAGTSVINEKFSRKKIGEKAKLRVMKLEIAREAPHSLRLVQNETMASAPQLREKRCSTCRLKPKIFETRAPKIMCK